MKIVAKAVIIDSNNNYLMMYRSDHPTFGNDPDIPGGVVEVDETTDDAVVREIEEETGIRTDTNEVTQVYSGTDYSEHGTCYILYVLKLQERPDIKISWEHESYRWLERDDFLSIAKGAKDTYMHMVCDVISKTE